MGLPNLSSTEKTSLGTGTTTSSTESAGKAARFRDGGGELACCVAVCFAGVAALIGSGNGAAKRVASEARKSGKKIFFMDRLDNYRQVKSKE